MSELSSSTSASPNLASPSTSLASLRGKRKATSDDLPPSPPSPPSPSDANETQGLAAKNDDPGDELKQPVKKKVKKPLEKIVPVWKDIKQWKEGDDPLGRFPVEVLDLIISVDSDLDLRDHLALAGTCRYFRTCYRDVVFRVLYQAAFPSVALFCVSSDDPDDNREFNGPFQRSFNDGRHIFSSGRSLVGAGGWAGWGLAGDDFLRNMVDSSRKSYLIQRILDQHWDDRPLELTKKENSSIAREWSRAFDSDTKTKEDFKQRQIDMYMLEHRKDRRSQQCALQDVYGLLPQWMQLEEPIYSTQKTDPVYEYCGLSPRIHDPWPSHWRAQVAKIVLWDRVDRKEAKETYKLTDRELLGLKELPAVRGRMTTKYYYKAAVEALSLRSHGGVGGHEQHV